MNRLGLTLIEILVAMAVLAIGATALAGLQLSSIKLAHVASMNARLLHVADSELQYRLLGLGSGETCTALDPAELEGIDCKATSEGCAALASGFSCSAESPGWPRRFTVRAAIPDGPQVTLSGVARRTGPP